MCHQGINQCAGHPSSRIVLTAAVRVQTLDPEQGDVCYMTLICIPALRAAAAVLMSAEGDAPFPRQELEYPEGHTSRSVYVALPVHTPGAAPTRR